MSNNSKSLFNAALAVMPGGVNSPVRAFNNLGDHPIYFAKGVGPYLFDVDDKRYIDYIGSWGPAIAGHSHPQIVSAVKKQLESGLSYGAPTELETKLAEKIIKLIPSAEKVRMTSSGTEAAMSAIRLARGYTNRELIIKFEGCYHGHGDSLLVKAGSGAMTIGIPDSAGVPSDLAKKTISLAYNDMEGVIGTFQKLGADIAAVIVEPIAGNMGCVLPSPGFLQKLRELTSKAGTLLIFDEVMTGFRVAIGGAQELFGVTPDLTVLGKIIGGGLPVGAIAGDGDIMDFFAPAGPVYQAGTLSGNPLAMASGLATLELISQKDFHRELEKNTTRLCEGLNDRAQKFGVNLCINHVCGMFGLFFSDQKSICNLAQVKNCDETKFKSFFNTMLENGINLAPSRFEAGFMSSAHGKDEINATLEAAEKAFDILSTRL
jgi:glutamate-1-semialdehyde 2,1-aminomutase